MIDGPGAIGTPERLRTWVLGSARRGARSARDGIPTPRRLRAELIPVRIFGASRIIGESTTAARADAGLGS
jgi:hypothetical protein